MGRTRCSVEQVESAEHQAATRGVAEEGDREWIFQRSQSKCGGDDERYGRAGECGAKS